MSAPEICCMLIISALSSTAPTVGADRLSMFQDFCIFTECLKKHSIITPLLLGSLELSFWWEQRNPNTVHQSESLFLINPITTVHGLWCLGFLVVCFFFFSCELALLILCLGDKEEPVW